MAAVELTPPPAPSGATTERSPQPGRLRAHLSDPLRRNGYSLILGSAITSALGLVFWVAAARLYDAGSVGIAGSLISAMGFLANIATLGLRNGLVRFVPTSHERAPSLIRAAYGTCAVAGAAAAIVFLIGQPWWAERLGLLRESPWTAIGFVVATCSWVIFVLQDSVLTGLRLTPWVPVENAVYAVAKLGLLVAMVAVPAWGIFVAWSLPALLLLVPVNVLMFRNLAARPRVESSAPRPTVADVVRFAAGDHTAAFLWLGTTELLTLVVLARAGAESSAYYYLAFTIAYSLYLVTSNVSSAFVVEAATHPDREDELVGRAVRQAARIVVPAAIVGVVAAPWALRIVGDDYARNATAVLRLLLLSAIPQVVVGLSVGRARAHRRVGLVIAVYLATAVALFSVTIVAAPRWGLTAVGWAWLATQLTMAAVLAPTVLAPGLLGPGILRRLERATVAAVGRRRTLIRQLRREEEAQRRLPSVFATAGLYSRRDFEVLRSVNDVIVARTVAADEPGLVVKLATSEAGSRSVTRHTSALARLAAGSSPGGRRWLPTAIATGLVDGRPFVIESTLPGVPADELPTGPRQALLASATAALCDLHESTATATVFDETLARRLIDAPLDVLRSAPHLADRGDDLDQIGTWLRAAFVGRAVELSWTHGDFWAGNVLGSTSGAELGGIIDWENARPDGIGAVDIAHLWLAEQPVELGQALLRGMTRPSAWGDAETSDAGVMTSGRCPLPARGVLLLAWLEHVASGLERATEHGVSRTWLSRNVAVVLDRADELPAPDARTTTHHRTPRSRPATADLASIGIIGAAVAAWTIGLRGVDPTAMTGTGLLSLLTPSMVVGLGLLTVGFVTALRRGASSWILAAHVVALLALLHGTPAVLYDTLRYSWAWKHVGIVDYIMRTGGVDTRVPISPIYQSWPGFFAGAALLTELTGMRNALRIAMWAPLAFNLLNLLGLRYLLRSITLERRLVWTAVWLFFITNWVGQDYFSPQAFAFFLHLVLIGTVLRGFRRPDRPDRPAGIEGTSPARTLPRAPAFVLIAATAAAIASSHQVTPFMAAASVTALVVVRRVRGWYLPAVVGLMVAGWAFTVGRSIVAENAESVIDSFGRPLSNAEELLEKTEQIDHSQVIVSQAGRGVVVVVGLLAVVGVVKLWRARRLDPAVVALAAVPALLPFATEFGGEAVFRVFLFALPMSSLLAASALLPVGERSHRSIGPWRALLATGLSVTLLGGFVTAYYGKEQQYFFTEPEIRASAWVAENSPPNTLLIEGSRNYPTQFRNYERFVYVPISREDRPTWEQILRDPVGKLGDWLDNDEYAATYLLITRSMKIDVDANGPLPDGSLDDVERALRASPAFEVAFETTDGVVFRLAPTEEADS